jgi:hypothetical protein
MVDLKRKEEGLLQLERQLLDREAALILKEAEFKASVAAREAQLKQREAALEQHQVLLHARESIAASTNRRFALDQTPGRHESPMVISPMAARDEINDPMMYTPLKYSSRSGQLKPSHSSASLNRYLGNWTVDANQPRLDASDTASVAMSTTSPFGTPISRRTSLVPQHDRDATVNQLCSAFRQVDLLAQKPPL